MKMIQTRIPEVVIIEPQIFEDERGWFMERFNEKLFHQQLTELRLPIPPSFVQDNYSCSKKSVLRGMHYQLAPHAQGKLVYVTKGAVYDVAVDLRKDSPTYKQWVSMELNATNHRMLWIPEGFAHGFLALEEDTHFVYKTTNFYSKEHERTLAWNHPELAIQWPNHNVIMNDRDRRLEMVDN